MKLSKVVCFIAFSFMAIVFCLGNAIAAEKGPIHFVMVTDLTGPAHAQVASEGWAAEDYLNYLNTQGGINGHPITIEVIDSKYQLPLMRTAYARNKDRKQMALSFDAVSGGIEAMKSQFIKDKVPCLMLTGHGPALYPTGWVFANMVPYDDVLCAYAEWIKKNWKEQRKPRLALLLGDYASGRSPELAKWYVEKIGVDIVSLEYVPTLPTDTSDILIRMRDKKPDFIFDTLMVDQCKVILRDKLKLGIKIPQCTFVFSSEMVKGTVSPEAYDGYMGIQACAAWWETGVPGVQLAYELHKKRGPIPNLTYISTVGACMFWVQAVKNALEKVGYDKLDGQAIYDGYEQIKNFNSMGIFKEITYYPDDHRGSKWVRITQLHKDGRVTEVAPYFEAPHNLKLKAKEGIK